MYSWYCTLFIRVVFTPRILLRIPCWNKKEKPCLCFYFESSLVSGITLPTSVSLTQFVGRGWGTGVSHSHPFYIYAQQRISQEGHMNWKRSMETYLWHKKPTGFICSLHLKGETMTLWYEWRFGIFFNFYFCVHLNRLFIHSYKKGAPRTRLVLYKPALSLSFSESWGEDGYPAIFAQVPAAGAALCPVGDPEPRGCRGEELRRHPAGVRREGVQHRRRSADSNIW